MLKRHLRQQRAVEEYGRNIKQLAGRAQGLLSAGHPEGCVCLPGQPGRRGTSPQARIPKEECFDKTQIRFMPWICVTSHGANRGPLGQRAQRPEGRTAQLPTAFSMNREIWNICSFRSCCEVWRKNFIVISGRFSRTSLCLSNIGLWEGVKVEPLSPTPIRTVGLNVWHTWGLPGPGSPASSPLFLVLPLGCPWAGHDLRVPAFPHSSPLHWAGGTGYPVSHRL